MSELHPAIQTALVVFATYGFITFLEVLGSLARDLPGLWRDLALSVKDRPPAKAARSAPGQA